MFYYIRGLIKRVVAEDREKRKTSVASPIVKSRGKRLYPTEEKKRDKAQHNDKKVTNV